MAVFGTSCGECSLAVVRQSHHVAVSERSDVLKCLRLAAGRPDGLFPQPKLNELPHLADGAFMPRYCSPYFSITSVDVCRMDDAAGLPRWFVACGSVDGLVRFFLVHPDNLLEGWEGGLA